MELDLNLKNVVEELREKFCYFIIEEIKSQIIKVGNSPKYSTMEKYINENNLINWITNKNNYISVYELYLLAANNFKVEKIDENNYRIFLDPNENIPNSYTTLYPIISLLEYGSLSVRKCEILTKIISSIIDVLDAYYDEFLTEANK